jgi:hypothetical protein
VQIQSHACARHRDANNTNPSRYITISPLVGCCLSACHPHGKPCDGKHQHHQVRTCQFVSYCCRQTNYVANLSFSDQTALLSLRPNDASVSSSNQTMRPSREQTKLDSHSYTKELRWCAQLWSASSRLSFSRIILLALFDILIICLHLCL